MTRKITESVAKIRLGLQDDLQLGNTNAKHDWGYAKEYVEAMRLMLQADQPRDFVIGTGEQHSARDCYEAALAYVNLDPTDFVRTDPDLVRPAEVDTLLADPKRADTELGWKSQASFAELVEIMVEADLEAQEKASGRQRGDSNTR